MAKRYTYQDVKEIVEKRGYELLSIENEISNEKGFVLTDTKIKIWCKNPNHEAEYKILRDFIRGKSGCRKCGYEERSKKLRLSIIEVRNEFEKEGYVLLSTEYENNHKKLKTLCPNGHEYHVSFSDFKNNKHRCKYCYDEIRSEIQRNPIEKIIFVLNSEGYSLLSEYKNNREKTLLKCPKDHIYEASFSDFQRGRRCPYCNESNGEREVSKVLEMLNITYEKQYKFKDCKLKLPLPFDFYLPQYNCCIEFDGEQHYKIIDFAGKGREWALDRFVGYVIHDTVKNEYCKNNNIKLIRIPYWKIKNIDTIIKYELKLQ